MSTPVISVGGASELEVRREQIDRKALQLMRKYNLTFAKAREYAIRGVNPEKDLNGRF